MYLNDKDVQQRVQEHYDEVVRLGYEVAGVFLQGSQNYGMDNENSDVDTKAIILPRFMDFVKGEKEVSFTHVFPNDEHIDIKDCRTMLKILKKQNVNFIEILFTKFKVINPKYQDIVERLIAERYRIAYYDKMRTMKSLYGIALEKRKALTHPYPSIKDKIDKYGYDPKQLCHIVRNRWFLEEYLLSIENPKGKYNYDKCLNNLDEKEFILFCKNVPRNKIMALGTADREISKLKDIRKRLDDMNFEIDEGVVEILDRINYDLLARFFKEELLSNGQ